MSAVRRLLRAQTRAQRRPPSTARTNTPALPPIHHAARVRQLHNAEAARAAGAITADEHDSLVYSAGRLGVVRHRGHAMVVVYGMFGEPRWTLFSPQARGSRAFVDSMDVTDLVAADIRRAYRAGVTALTSNAGTVLS
jgi:hypothetical protein